ncbi:MAG: arginine--tRNA ligase [Bacteroidota bacterium]|nr:arginine--tRNA ligase [Bacteroidota bacterium]
MIRIEQLIKKHISEVVNSIYNLETESSEIILQKTRKEFQGDFTLVVFPFTRFSKLSPEATADQIGKELLEKLKEITNFNVVKGFLNLTVNDAYWINFLSQSASITNYGFSPKESKETIVIEYPSPNTNKPLHLGHLRNIFLGNSVTEILKANGHKLIHTCLYNDRGTNISKSMLAWKMFGNGETPGSRGIKGDKFVGEFYVKFSDAYKREIKELTESGLSEEEAAKKSKLNASVNELTVKWEQGDKEVRDLWETMNGWVYDGIEQTYNSLGIKPDKNYYESDVYNLGKETVIEGLTKGVFYKKEDGSVWIDLTEDGLDHKLVLRSNGTTVYITQDIAIANEKDKDFNFNRSIYVVGNEQEYHFKVLFLILKKLGRKWADNLYHLSYGMVELPSGKMKSREGTVVDADDLLEEMVETAKKTTQELGKIEGFTNQEAEDLYKSIGYGALKYFILKVDPKKKMLFNPQESIDFNGNTSPFIQYSYARIQSILRRAEASDFNFDQLNKIDQKEKDVIKLIHDFPAIISEAGDNYSPALIGNYVYELAKMYNQFYHENPVLKEENENLKLFRLSLSSTTGKIIKSSMNLLGIDVPEKM